MSDDDLPSPYENLAQKIRGGKSASAIEYENRVPTITVTRRKDGAGLGRALKLFGGFGFLVSQFTFVVQLNGQVVGNLQPGESITFKAAAGCHYLRVSTPVVASPIKTLDLTNGKQLRFSCQTKFTGIILQRAEDR